MILLRYIKSSKTTLVFCESMQSSKGSKDDCTYVVITFLGLPILIYHQFNICMKCFDDKSFFGVFLRTKTKEIQNLNGQIRDTGNSLDAIKSERRRETAILEGLQQQTARLEVFVYNYKNNNEEYI